MKPDYSYSDIVRALKSAGLKKGDTVFTHVGMGMLGYPEEGRSEKIIADMIVRAFFEVLGITGTLIVPAYTYSFCDNQEYNPLLSPSKVGFFTEYFRNLKGVKRSLDPIFSVSAKGPMTEKILADLPHECFGKDCVYDRLIKYNAKLCNIGVGFRYATFVHYAEQMLSVPYRFKKLFCGIVNDKSGSRKEGWIYNVRILAENSYPDLRELEQYAMKKKKILRAPLGRGEVTCVRCSDMYKICEDNIKRDPWFLAKGPAGNPLKIEERRLQSRKSSTGSGKKIVLKKPATMDEMVKKLWKIPRDIVSDGYDEALELISTQVPVRKHEYPTGMECWTWFIPEKWTLIRASLETVSGEEIFSTDENRLHVMSYSLPFDGIVTKKKLFKHLKTHPYIPDAVPFSFNYYERDWGLCCSSRLKKTLNDKKYRVKIDTEFSYGKLKVGEITVPGISRDTIILSAHLCHPAMVNDGLAGVAAAVEVMRRLLKSKKKLYYTYKLLIVPETIGTIAYLSRNEKHISKIKGGIFLEMLGLDYPHVLQKSFNGDTEFDRTCIQGIKEFDKYARVGDFLKVITNDERQFNAPGIRIPMVSLSRVAPFNSKIYPYREYHSDYDSPKITSSKKLKESCDLIMHIIDVLENRCVPVNKFKGEIFFSRYGMSVARHTDPMFYIDGCRTVSEIAEICGKPFDEIKEIVDEIVSSGLAEYRVKRIE